jgi:hypothetical protein
LLPGTSKDLRDLENVDPRQLLAGMTHFALVVLAGMTHFVLVALAGMTQLLFVREITDKVPWIEDNE